ncbi:hypothetical protein DSQ19_04855 [Candidatus Nitrosotenuis sp. DW1]|nr:hypothetical protein DSQ19_04855 [Candidatus Nitrosotenuis sp. DW1]
MWTITVAVALSSLLVLAYFILNPITAKEGTIEQTKTGLDKAINRIETLHEESKQVPMPTDSSLNP